MGLEVKRYRVEPGTTVRLARLATDERGGFSGKKEARTALDEVRERMDERLRVMAAQARFGVVVILQGMDAAGKDGTVRRVFTGVNPANVVVTSFKEPSAEERAHPFLWRVERHAPAYGQMAVWNRSHYEDVLVPRGRGLMGPRAARRRLREIAARERLWAANRLTVLKFFLHISPEEQERRFASRRETRRKQWKVRASDERDRERWGAFQEAYEEAIAATSTAACPWYVVPADRKWYRDVVVGTAVWEAVRGLKVRWPKGESSRSTPADEAGRIGKGNAAV